MAAVRNWLLGLLGILVVLAVLFAAGLYFLVSRLDVRAEVERAVEGATGRELTLSGAVGVSYWPVLGLHAAGASLANVEGGRAPAFLTAEDIHVGVELWPLLERRVVVRRLVLQQPAIALEVDQQGRPNWIFGPPRRPAPPPGAAPATPRPPAPQPSGPVLDVTRATLRQLDISNGEVSFFDARRGAGWIVGDVDISSDLSNLDQPMHLAGDVLFNEKPVDLDIEVARPGAALRGEPTAIKLNIESELLNARLEGATVAASGELNGAVAASGPSLRQLAAWGGTPFQGGVGLERFEVTGRVAIGGGRYDFSNSAFSLDRISGRGDFVLAQHTGRPYFSGRLQLADFDLNPYLVGQTPAQSAACGRRRGRHRRGGGACARHRRARCAQHKRPSISPACARSTPTLSSSPARCWCNTCASTARGSTWCCTTANLPPRCTIWRSMAALDGGGSNWMRAGRPRSWCSSSPSPGSMRAAFSRMRQIFPISKAAWI